MKPTPEILAYFPGKQAEIISYAKLLASVATERGLVGPKEADRIWERHIANCVPITTIIPQAARVVDIGSGAGLPGIVIALARPDLKVTLVEPLQRRVDFLLEVVDQLQLPIQVVRGRAEAVKMQFEIITCRAVAPLEKLIQISWHMIPKGGILLAIKGESAQKEIDKTKLKKGATTQLHQINLPNLPVARVVEVKKGA